MYYNLFVLNNSKFLDNGVFYTQSEKIIHFKIYILDRIVEKFNKNISELIGKFYISSIK